MSKIDHKKTLAHLYNPSRKAVVRVDVPPMQFLMIDGQGDPNTALSYQQALEALFGLSYALKFMVKKRGGPDYTVMPLEGLWWMDVMPEFDFDADKSLWQWTSMMMQPDAVTPALFAEAVETTGRKKDLPALPLVRLESFHEGPAAQIMHIGPFSAERPTIERVHAFIAEGGGVRSGKHHEIYLSDFRRTAPEKLRTVIRQPMTPA